MMDFVNWDHYLFPTFHGKSFIKLWKKIMFETTIPQQFFITPSFSHHQIFGFGLPPYSPESRSGSAISHKAAPVGSPRRYLVKPPVTPPRPPVTLVKITRIFTRGEFYGLWSVYGQFMIYIYIYHGISIVNGFTKQFITGGAHLVVQSNATWPPFCQSSPLVSFRTCLWWITWF